LAITPFLPAEDVPVPAEVQALVEKMITALKTNDDPALSACWHTPETLAKARVEEKQREAATSPKPFNMEKEQERELKRQTRDLEATLKRAAQLRTLLPLLSVLACVGARVCDKYVLVPRSVGVELDVVAPTGT
jgi:hypothetical protein